MQFPLLGLARDFHPLDNAHAERTPTKRMASHKRLAIRFFVATFCNNPNKALPLHYEKD
jgi:hypothetical protein